MKIPGQLKKIGLEDNNSEVYLALLELGPSSVQTISLKTGLKRTTIYDLLKNLTSQGLVTQTIRGKKRLFLAEDPEAIKERLQKKVMDFDEILPELKSLHFIPGLKPKIKYYEGLEGIKVVLEDTLKSKEKNIKSIVPMKDLIELIGEDYFNDYTKRRIKGEYFLKVVRPTKKEVISFREKYKQGTSKVHLREVRFAPSDFDFSLTMFLYDNKVALISSKKENFGLIIESEEFVYNQKALFEVLWKSCKP